MRGVELSFIVPCFNSAGTLEATLQSIRGQALNSSSVEVIVVDNGSSDRTVAIAESYGVRVLRCERRGAGCARNAGARVASGTFIAFIDSDVELERDWAVQLLSAMRGSNFAAALGPVVPSGPDNFLTEFRRTNGLRRYRGTSVSVFDPNGVSPVINTAACMVRRTLFWALGGFDERLHRLEDTEFSQRLFRYGGVIYACSNARAKVYYQGNIWSYLKRAYACGVGSLQVKRMLFGKGYIMDRTTIKLTVVLLSFLFNAAAQVPPECRQDVEKFAPGQTWELLERANFLPLDHFFGDLTPDCRAKIIPGLVKQDPCLDQLHKICPSRELNRVARGRCARKNVSVLPIRCNQSLLRGCVERLEFECKSKQTGSCPLPDRRETGALCPGVPSSALQLMANCGAETLTHCVEQKATQEEIGKCLRGNFAKLRPRCQGHLAELYEQGDVCWFDTHLRCATQGFRPQQRVACLLGERDQLRPLCYERMRPLFLAKACLQGEHKDCNKGVEQETLNCLRGRIDRLAPECLQELKGWLK